MRKRMREDRRLEESNRTYAHHGKAAAETRKRRNEIQRPRRKTKGIKPRDGTRHRTSATPDSTTWPGILIPVEQQDN